MMTRGCALKPRDLIEIAKSSVVAHRRKPKHATLCRAISTVYYALFHCLAYNCANVLLGGPGSGRNLEAWQKAYRALEHGQTKAACKDARSLANFHADVQAFADAFVTLQERRHSADYDPLFRTTKSEVMDYIERAEAVIDAFNQLPVHERRPFAAHVMFKRRP
jgi:uncharacterized protein (UPF0332 family)